MRLNIHLDPESDDRLRRLAAGFRVPMMRRNGSGETVRDAWLSEVVQWGLEHLEHLAAGGMFDESPVAEVPGGPVEWKGGGE